MWNRKWMKTESRKTKRFIGCTLQIMLSMIPFDNTPYIMWRSVVVVINYIYIYIKSSIQDPTTLRHIYLIFQMGEWLALIPNAEFLRSPQVRVTSHTRLRAHNHCTLNTLLGGKGRARPSSIYTTLGGPTVQVNARRMSKSTWIPTWHQTDHVAWSIGLSSKAISWK